MRVAPWRSIGIGAVAGAAASVAVFFGSLVWNPTGGRVPPTLLAPLLLVLARPLLDRLAMRLAGRGDQVARADGPRVLWASLAMLSPLFCFGAYDGFWSSFTHGPWLRFGYVGLDSIDHLLGWGFVIAGPFVGLAAYALARGIDAWSAPWLQRAVRGIALALCLLPVPMSVQRAMIAPTAAEYEASLEVVGTIPETALPTGPAPSPRINPKGYEVYPYAIPVPDVGPFHVARYCSPTICTVYVSRDALPERDDEGLLPRRAWNLYDRGDGFELRRDPIAKFLFSRRLSDGQHDWVGERDLGSAYDHPGLARTIAPPLSIVVAPIVGAVFALLFLRRKRDGTRLSDGWNEARLEADGLVHFDDGAAPARPPATAARHEGPVLVKLESAAPSTFRETGAATITRLFPGTRADLAMVEELGAASGRAFAIAVAILLAMPLIAAAFSDLC